MKKIFFLPLVAVLALAFAGCLKGTNSEPCVNKTPASEATAMQAYATSKNYNVTTHSSGLLYEVVNAGIGVVPSLTSRIFVTYTGRLIPSDEVFDDQTNHTLTGWQLQSLIPGWQMGLPLIAKGGTIRLILPSSLAYGCTGYASIPRDALLFFEINLVDVQ